MNATSPPHRSRPRRARQRELRWRHVALPCDQARRGRDLHVRYGRRRQPAGRRHHLEDPMKCTECGNKMTRSVVDHVYRESGLDNVILHGVTKYTCESCGAERVQIPHMGPLHRAIAQAIAHKPARLVPAEVRFLRDHLDLSNKEFAALMGVSPEQASRWTSSEPIGVPAERFLR